MGSISTHKPHVVCLGTPQHAGADYISEFIRSFTFSILEACNRTEAVAKLPDLIASKGPVDAFIIRMGTPPYEPFDAEFLSLLGPTCRLVVSASAGYNEFPIDWLSENKILFCNSVDAVAEATADMAVWLLLSVLRNTSRAERSARAGTWRYVGGLIPARDPAGLTLGIVGLGAIGKVR
jgi:lactate dehydrogenase-like 2-hydroxyacid dehydrogenase